MCLNRRPRQPPSCDAATRLNILNIGLCFVSPLSSSYEGNNFMRCLLLMSALAVTVAPLSAQTAASVTKAAETISATDIARHIGVIAADSMLGRDTPSNGLELTARYVADQFRALGLKPGGDSGTWFQRWPVLSDTWLFHQPSPSDTGTVPNTVGILEGTDPKLKHEYIVFSAHMDHIGISRGATPDSINNGADDNASGTAGIIALAKAFSQPGARPRRSMIFLTVSGEEKGLLGSAYFVENPPVPIEQFVANFNFDVIGGGKRDRAGALVNVTGADYSDLGATLDRVLAAHPELRLTTFREERMSSDHVCFAGKGVPILRFGGGQNDGIHQVTDSPEKVDADFEAAVLRLAFYVAHDVANANQRPKWDQASYKKLTGR